MRSYEKSELAGGKNYRFKVRAYTELGESAWSLEQAILTSIPPDAPVDVMVDETASTSTVFKIDWKKGQNDGDDPVIDYIVYKRLYGTAAWT